MSRVLCLLGFHSLMTNIYGPHPNVYTCVRCRRSKWVADSPNKEKP